MTMQTAMEHLWQAVNELRGELFALRLTAVEDRPRSAPGAPVDAVGAVVGDLADWSSELIDAAARGTSAAQFPPDLAGVRRSLDDCADRMERLALVLHERLAAPGRLDELATLARHGGPELRAWVGAVKQALDRTYQNVWTTQAAVTACWRELADRATTACLSDAPEHTRS